MANWKGKSVWSVVDNFAQQALSFGIFAMLARVLSPAEFGLLAIAHLLVQFVPGRKSYTRFLALFDLLEARLNRRVELVTTEALSPFMGPRILAEAQDVLRAA